MEGRKGKDPILPYFSHFLNIFASVNFSIVKHNNCDLPHCKGELVEEIRDAFGCHVFSGAEAMILAAVINHSPDIELCASVRWNGDVFALELPAIWHISFCTSETSFSKIEINEVVTVLLFKLLQLLLLISVELQRGCLFGKH